MSFVVVAPEVLAAAASDLAGIGSTLAQANAAALAPTTAVLAAGADEVSAAIASLFGAHGQAYQAVSAQMSAFHAQFMQALTGAGGAYAAAEAVNVSAAQSVEQDLLAAINARFERIFGRPLIGSVWQRRGWRERCPRWHRRRWQWRKRAAGRQRRQRWGRYRWGCWRCRWLGRVAIRPKWDARAVSAPTQANPLWAICTSIGQVDSRPHTSTRLVPDPWVGPGKAAVRVG